MKLTAKIRFNREIDSVDDVISIGSFGVNIGSKEVIFDMMDSAIYIDKKDGFIVTYEGWNLDVESFPDSALLEDTYRYINTLTRINVDTEDVSLYPVKVEEFIFLLRETKVPLSKEVLDKYNEALSLKKTAPKYTCIITSEADLPDKQLDYFSDNPWDGNLEEVIMFNTIGELFQHDVEGLFYQLYENEHGTRLGYGMVDPDYPAADIQDFEKKSEKKEQKLKLCLVRDKNTFHVGDKVIHFKWELNSEHTDNYIYEITGFPKNTETEEQYVAYRSVADPSKEWVRPIMEFLSEVDHQKYPEIKQKYRFVKY